MGKRETISLMEIVTDIRIRVHYPDLVMVVTKRAILVHAITREITLAEPPSPENEIVEEIDLGP